MRERIVSAVARALRVTVYINGIRRGARANLGASESMTACS